ncbi:Cas10/Cmr2 second palm domain-containing protein [Leptotrichia trevisanii]
MDKNKTFKEVLDENKFLVSIETVKIKDFIFSTNKLKLIRGASYLLDYMNQVEVPRILRKYGLEYNTKGLVDKIYDISDDEEFLRKVDEKIDGAIDKRILYVGAGNAKFLVENEKDAKNICKEIKELYSEIAPSAKVVAEFHPMEKDEKIWDAIDELVQKTAEKKSEGFPMLNIDLPFAVKCDLSGMEPAVVSWKSIKSVENDLDSIDIHKSGYDWKLNNEKRNSEGIVKFQNDTDKQKKDTIKAIENVIKESGLNISEESAVKIKYSNKMIKDDVNEIGFYSIIKKALKDDIHLNTEIDDYAVGDNFIGLIYSDGDGLGDFFKNVKKIYTTEEEYLKFMRKFSVILDRNTKYVLKEVIKEMYEKGKFMKKKPILKDGKPKYEIINEKKKIVEKSVIGEFLIVGGDDVCAVFPADLALEISAEFQKQFEEKMNKFTENENKNNEVKNSENITSSCGVVIAKGKTPMFQLFEQGLKLQKLAKGKRYNENQIRDEKAKRTGYIDFQVIGNEGNVDIKGYRKKWFDKFDNKKNENKLHISKRPYSINKIDDDVSENIDKLIENVKDLKKENFPNTKIRYIYDLKKDETKTDNEKIMESINILSKMSEEDIQVLNKLWGIKDKMKLDFNNENKEFKKLFDNIFDVLEIYDFIQKDEKSLEKEDNKSGN